VPGVIFLFNQAQNQLLFHYRAQLKFRCLQFMFSNLVKCLKIKNGIGPQPIRTNLPKFLSKKPYIFHFYYFCSGEMAEWSIAAVLKTVEGNTSGGSNPSLSANIYTRFGGYFYLL
jgi:hypothetical protein